MGGPEDFVFVFVSMIVLSNWKMAIIIRLETKRDIIIVGLCIGCVFTALVATVTSIPDVDYYVRMLIINLTTRKSLKSIFEDTMESKIVTYADIDRNSHMNNARYLRELNFSRRKHFYSLGIWPVLQAHNLNLIVQAQTIRYRKELSCWHRYTIRSRVLYWSDAENSFYLEARFESPSGFVLAIQHVKYRLVGSKSADKKLLQPSRIMQLAALEGEPRDAPSFLLSWIDYLTQSSEALNPLKTNI